MLRSDSHGMMEVAEMNTRGRYQAMKQGASAVQEFKNLNIASIQAK